MRRSRVAAWWVVLALIAGVLGGAPAAASTSKTGEFLPLRQTRIIDTRTGLGLPKQPLRSRSTTRLQITGRGGVPAIERGLPTRVAAVVLNVTVVTPQTDGYLVLYETGTARPAVSSLNVNRGTTAAGMVTAAVSFGGTIEIYNSAGDTTLIVDVLGFYTLGDVGTDPRLGPRTAMVPLPAPVPLADTLGQPEGALNPGEVMRATLSLGDPQLNAQVRALWVVVTATQPTGGGFLTTWGPGKPVSVSMLNFTKGQPVTNAAIVPTTPCLPCGDDLPPSINIRNTSTGRVQVRVEAVGVFLAGSFDGGYYLQLTPPRRITDSRTGLNGTVLKPHTTQVTGVPNVAGPGKIGATVGTITAIRPSATTRIQAWSLNGFNGASIERITLLAPAGRTTSAPLFVASGNPYESPQQHIYLQSENGQTQYTVDVIGRFRTDVGALDFQLKPSAVPATSRER